jgi:hypothetical protein
VSADPTVYERYMMRATEFFKQHLGTPK